MQVRRLLVAGLAVVAVAAAVYVWVEQNRSDLPPGIVNASGRIESDQTDISTKQAGRIAEVLVQEGDQVAPGQLVARMDVAELDAELARAVAEVARSESQVAAAEAVIAQRESELLFADQELKRTSELVSRGVASVQRREEHESRQKVAKAALKAAEAQLITNQRVVEASQAQERLIKTRIEDANLVSPFLGRVLYRLAEPGEVLGAGGRVLTIINLNEVHMEVFVPLAEAHRLAIGSESRIVIDGAPFYVPANVSFVSPESQFTPKQVETLSEREKLVFRVKLRIPTELVQKHINNVKTGVRGVAYLRLQPNPPDWPDILGDPIPDDLSTLPIGN